MNIYIEKLMRKNFDEREENIFGYDYKNVKLDLFF